MSDPKNPEDKPAAPKTGDATRPYISSRLREKLSEGGDKEWSPKSSSPIPGIIGGLVLIGILAGVFMWWQSSMKKEEAAKAAAVQKAAIADSIATAARAESIATAVRADSTARADSLLAHGGKGAKAKAAAAATKSASPSAAKTASTTPAKGSGGGSKTGGASASEPAAAPAAKAAPTDGFGIAVGQFMLEDRANGEKDKLVASTGLVGKVAPVDDGGTTVYRVILGKWSSRAPAEKKATALIDSSLVHEARVVARPK